MMELTFVLWIVTLTVALGQPCGSENAGETVSWDYCVIGAGPGGLQMGYFLDRASRDYVIFERGNSSGTFYQYYPRHRKLISINKRHTGKTNKEFNLRHDWNSLLSDDESLLVKHYSREFFPHADDYVRYLNDYTKKLGLNVKYNTEVSNITRHGPDVNHTDFFTMLDQEKRVYTCKYIIVSTGIALPKIPTFQGAELSEGYEDLSMDQEEFEGQSVLILGRGNSAFETADHIMGNTNVIHMMARSRVKLAWATHYVGDLRAVNNGILDTYQLKSLDGILEGDVSDVILFKTSDGKIALDVSTEKFKVPFPLANDTNSEETLHLPDNFPLREAYDRVIRCLGFQFDFSIFSNDDTDPGPTTAGKYPTIKPDYEAEGVPGMFFAGTNTHSIDFRKSAGGFIHGFRYTARALHRSLEYRNHQVPWPSVAQPVTALLDHIIKRMNEASGLYQMFVVLADVVILHDDGLTYDYLEEFPLKMIHKLPELSGRSGSQYIIISMEYGKNFSVTWRTSPSRVTRWIGPSLASNFRQRRNIIQQFKATLLMKIGSMKDRGPGKDIFRADRATGDPQEAHISNFLHPVLYYYKYLPTEDEMNNLPGSEILPTPAAVHHIVEDFLTDWTAPISHVLLLRRFLETALHKDLRHFWDQQCFHLALTHYTLPLQCEQYMAGQGLSGNQELWDAGSTASV